MIKNAKEAMLLSKKSRVFDILSKIENKAFLGENRLVIPKIDWFQTKDLIELGFEVNHYPNDSVITW